jgi:hypothetical protein
VPEVPGAFFLAGFAARFVAFFLGDFFAAFFISTEYHTFKAD